MPIDPNSETSDIGQMYRQYIQSKGMPLTQGNLQSVIAQSQREPGMIAGLGVQQAPPPMSAPTPMNIAGASPSSSGNAMPIPPVPPTGIPPSNPIPPQSLPHAPFPAPTGDAPPTPTIPTPTAVPQPPPQTPIPGQPPAPNQVSASQDGGGIGGMLAALGGGSGVALLLSRLINGGDYGRKGSAPQAMVEGKVPGAVAPTAEGVAAAVNSGTPIEGTNIAPEVRPPTAPSTGPLVGESAPSSSPVAAAIEKSVPTIPHENTNAGGPKPIDSDINTPAYLRRPAMPPQQGPVTAPPRNSNPYPVDDGVSIPAVRPSPEIPASLQRQTSEQQFVNGVKPVGPPQSPVAAAMEKSVPPILMKGEGRNTQVPEYLNRQRNNAEDIRGVRPVGPEIQGPPMGPPPIHGTPGPMQGPPEMSGNEVTPTSIIENLLHPKMSAEVPRVGNTVPRAAIRAFRGVRMP